MQILAIDYGRKKLGLAVGDTDSKLAKPLEVFRFKTVEKVLAKIEQVVLSEQVKLVLIGISEGKMAKETEKFGGLLIKSLNVPVEYYDETLTTREAQELAIDAGIKRKKRKNLEDAYAASLILQSYLENYQV